MININLQHSVNAVLNSGRYRLVEKLEKKILYNQDDVCKKHIGMFVDVETTGLNPEKDKVIELAFVLFEFSSDGRIFKILEEYSHYQDPGFSIPIEITELTGITDDMVKGQQIDAEAVISYIERAVLMIAHNAAFDRPFIEALIPGIPRKHWACSMCDITWRKAGIEGLKLEYIAYKFGFYFEGHRAAMDCLAGIEILSKTLPKSNELAMSEMLASCRKERFRLCAINTPYAKKDMLKDRGYKWHDSGKGTDKFWYIDKEEIEAIEELVFLWGEVYSRVIDLRIDIPNALDRYSERALNPVSHHDKQKNSIETLVQKAKEDFKSRAGSHV